MDAFDRVHGFLGGSVLKKKHDHDFFSEMFKNDEFQKRYLLLMTTQLRYYHNMPSDLSESRDSEISLGIISNVETSHMQEQDGKTSWLFVVDIHVRQFTFKVASREIADHWVKNILLARDFYMKKILGRTKPLPVDENVGKTKFWQQKSQIVDFFASFTSVTSSASKAAANTQTTTGSKNPHEPYNSLDVSNIIDLENLILSDKRIMKRLATAFFDKLETFSKKVASDRCKQMGMALSLWVELGELPSSQVPVADRIMSLPISGIDVIETETSLKSLIPPKINTSLSNRSNSSHRRTKANDIIRTWLTVSISRELYRSCDIHKAQKSLGSIESSYLKDNTSSTTGAYSSSTSDAEGQDLPFRGDHPEAIFVTMFLRASIQLSGIIGQWLASIILTTSTSPEHYTFVSNLAATMQSQQDRDIHSFTDETRPSITSTNPSFSSIKNTPNRNSLLLLPKATKAFQHPNDSVYFLIIRACSVIVQKIHAFKINMPPPLVIFIDSLKALTLGTGYQAWSDVNDGFSGEIRRSSLSRPVSAFSMLPLTEDENLDDEDRAMLARIFDAADERVFVKSLSSVLFLRLICPAIISPMEWGSLHQWSKADQSSNARHRQSKIMRSSIDGPSNQSVGFNTNPNTYSTTTASPAISPPPSQPSSAASTPSNDQSRQKGIPPEFAHAVHTPPTSKSSMNGSPTCFLVLLALVLCQEDIGDETRLRRSFSLSSSNMSSPVASPRHKATNSHTKKDLLEYFKPSNSSLGNESDDTLYQTAKEIKKKLIQLAFAADEQVLQKTLQDYQASMIELSEDDQDEITVAGCDMNSLQAQFGLIEVAKVMQKIANMACMADTDMESFIASDMIWQRKRTSALAIPSSGGHKEADQNTSESMNNQTLSLDETGVIFSQELSIVAKMLRKFYIDSSNACERQSRPASPGGFNDKSRQASRREL